MIRGFYFLIAGSGFDASRFHADSQSAGVAGSCHPNMKEISSSAARRFLEGACSSRDEPLNAWCSEFIEVPLEAGDYREYADILPPAEKVQARDGLEIFLESLERKLPDSSRYSSRPVARSLHLVTSPSESVESLLSVAHLRILDRLSASSFAIEDAAALHLANLQQDF
jgi:hypothetical protein